MTGLNPAEEYILNKKEPSRSILLYLQKVIELTFPEADLLFKWHLPFYYIDKKPFCYLNATKGYVDLAFFHKGKLSSYDHYLVSEKRKVVKSFRYRSMHDLDEPILIEVLKIVKSTNLKA